MKKKEKKLEFINGEQSSICFFSFFIFQAGGVCEIVVQYYNNFL